MLTWGRVTESGRVALEWASLEVVFPEIYIGLCVDSRVILKRALGGFTAG